MAKLCLWGPNHVRKAIFLVFLISLIIFIWPQHSMALYRSTELEKVETDNGVEYRMNGVLTYAADLRYAYYTRTIVKSEQRTVIDAYFDADGKPAEQKAGHYALKRVYDGENEIQTIYLDENHDPITNTSGYSTRMREYQDGHVIKEWYLDISGSPVKLSSGYYGRINEWENGRNTIVTYVDENWQPVNIKSGYAISKRTFYEEGPWVGRIESEYYFDASGLPVSLSNHQFGAHKEYDELGRNTVLTCLGENGEALKTVVRTFYPDDTVETERYYDGEGNPQRQASGNYGIKKIGDKTVYLDKEGREYQDLNRLLHNEPLLVVCFGAMVLLLSLFLSRRANFLLLLLYILFILYMTLWNRNGETRAELELFWSYKQFLSSPSLRMEILNNIWLFIPLGAILMKLIGWRGIIVCIVLSCIIEVVQYFTGFGLAEFDDIISNGLGGAIGAMAVGRVCPSAQPQRMVRNQSTRPGKGRS